MCLLEGKPPRQARCADDRWGMLPWTRKLPVSITTPNLHDFIGVEQVQGNRICLVGAVFSACLALLYRVD